MTHPHLPGEHHPIYSVEVQGTTYFWSQPFWLGYYAMAVVLLNILVWGGIGLYDAVRLFV